jgi:excinuclease ABC subunit C
VSELTKKLLRAPNKPGVYLMKDRNGTVLYAGKAVNLKNRLLSYFRPGDSGAGGIKTAALVKQIVDFETVVTASENEALILESNLIKRHRPRYNVVLKDDKRYPSLRIDPNEPYPAINIVRKIGKDGARYFGPYSSAAAVHQTLRVIHKHFKLRKCKLNTFRNRVRPCLQYQMDRCLAPCCLAVDPEHYRDIVQGVTLFLKGRTPELIKRIKAEMSRSAAKQEFERAARLRDKMFALTKTIERQVAVTTDFKDRDVVAVCRGDGEGVVTLLNVRGGYLIGTRHHPIGQTLSNDAELISSFLRQYYEKHPFLPQEILLPTSAEPTSDLQRWVDERSPRKVSIRIPLRGEKARLSATAAQNAAIALQELQARRRSEQAVLERLQKRLGMAVSPHRIECFDNSNLLGKSPVAAMVVFENGRPAKHRYRRYHIRTVRQPDDYAAMAEVLHRRYGRENGRNRGRTLSWSTAEKVSSISPCGCLTNWGCRPRFPSSALPKQIRNGERPPTRSTCLDGPTRFRFRPTVPS